MRVSEVARVSVFTHPIRTTWVLLEVLVAGIAGLVAFVRTHLLACGTAAAAAAAFVALLRDPPLALEGVRALALGEGSFALYWLTLGILSSVGLGSGLHTFVLFLGPHIVRVASAAVLHRGTAGFSAEIVSFFKWPASWDVAGLSEAFSPNYAVDAWDASMVLPDDAQVTFLAVASKVAWPSFLWGLGTALGELPPYFVARAAARTGQVLQEISEVGALEEVQEASKAQRLLRGEAATAPGSSGSGRRPDSRPSRGGVNGRSGGVGLFGRAKIFVFESVQKYGFFAILLAASIPNPLFDLAGITCGHFGISFWTFFGATALGKAVFKVSIQVIFIVGFVLFGPSAFEALRTRAPAGGLLHSAISRFEAGVLAGQHAMCTREAGGLAQEALASRATAVLADIAHSPHTDPDAAALLLHHASSGALDACHACCAVNFRSLGFPQCWERCDTAAATAALTAGAPADGAPWSLASVSSSFLREAPKQAWGLFLLAMILYFLLSIVHSLVQERLMMTAVPDDEEAEEGEDAAAAGPPAPAPSSRKGKGQAAVVATAPRSSTQSRHDATSSTSTTRTPAVQTAVAPDADAADADAANAHAGSQQQQQQFHGSNIISALAHVKELRKPGTPGRKGGDLVHPPSQQAAQPLSRTASSPVVRSLLGRHDDATNGSTNGPVSAGARTGAAAVANGGAGRRGASKSRGAHVEPELPPRRASSRQHHAVGGGAEAGAVAGSGEAAAPVLRRTRTR